MDVILYVNPVEDVALSKVINRLIVIEYVNYVGPVMQHHMIEKLWDCYPDKIPCFLNLASFPRNF
jgi:hypothetical protein